MEDYKSEPLTTGLISFTTMVIAYLSYIYTKDIPFNYITQTDYSICDLMNGTFCSRISYLIIAVSVYFIYIQINNSLSIPVKNAIEDEPKQAINGIYIGALISILSILINILFGFIELNGINYQISLFYPFIICIGMLMTGFTEELLFRALPINALRSYVSDDILVLVTAIFFGYIHSGYSFYYGISSFVFGILIASGFLKYGLYWAAGLHFAHNTIETIFYSIVKFKNNNPLMAGERSTPDDDGSTTTIITFLSAIILKYLNYF
jgi:membrane protease YdiL (CAAX protease family)